MTTFYHIRKYLHWRLRWHDWEKPYICDCPDYEKLMKWKKFKWCHYCGVHSELNCKNW